MNKAPGRERLTPRLKAGACAAISVNRKQGVARPAVERRTRSRIRTPPLKARNPWYSTRLGSVSAPATRTSPDTGPPGYGPVTPPRRDRPPGDLGGRRAHPRLDRALRRRWLCRAGAGPVRGARRPPRGPGRRARRRCQGVPGQRAPGRLDEPTGARPRPGPATRNPGRRDSVDARHPLLAQQGHGALPRASPRRLRAPAHPAGMSRPARGLCVFRSMSATHFGGCRPGIPESCRPLLAPFRNGWPPRVTVSQPIVAGETALRAVGGGNLRCLA